MKIVVTDANTISNDITYFDPLKEFGEVSIYPLSEACEIPERINDADIVVCNKNIFDEKNLKHAKNLKYIGLFATGYNNIDTNYCKSKNITVCNAGSYSTNAVAQHTFALILNHYNKIIQYNTLVQNNGWIDSPVFSPFHYTMNELSNKTIGIIGYGNIGKKVAKIANTFDMNVIVFTRTKTNDNTVKFVNFDTLIKSSDIITVHCPLNAETEKLFNEEAFSNMKSNAYFVNTSRGGVMDEDALYNALNSNAISGAAIDVLTTEPMSPECRLLHAKNITITPHVAWAPTETRERLMKIVCNNIRAFLDGNPTNVVSS